MENDALERLYCLFSCFIEFSVKRGVLNPQEFISYCNSFSIENCEKIFNRDEQAARSLDNEMHPNGSAATLKLASMADIKDKAYVLDAGCGHGGAARVLAEKYPDIKIVGIDKDPLRVMDAIFRSKVENISNLEFRAEDAYKMTFKDNTFDIIIRQHSVYGGDERLFVSECRRVLKPGGRIAFQGVLCMKSFKKKKMFMDDYSLNEYNELLTGNGFRIIDTEIKDSTSELLESVRNSNRSYYELVKNGVLTGIKLAAEKTP